LDDGNHLPDRPELTVHTKFTAISKGDFIQALQDDDHSLINPVSPRKEVISVQLKRKLWLLAAVPVIGATGGVALALAAPALAATATPAPAATSNPSPGSGSSTTHTCPNM
jgi:hypothetical protein